MSVALGAAGVIANIGVANAGGAIFCGAVSVGYFLAAVQCWKEYFAL